MAFEKGRAKTGGIKKGTPRKETQLLTEMIDGALAKLGGMDWLEQQGRENPTAFMSLIGKRLPKDLSVTGNLNLDAKVVYLEKVDKGL